MQIFKFTANDACSHLKQIIEKSNRQTQKQLETFNKYLQITNNNCGGTDDAINSFSTK